MTKVKICGLTRREDIEAVNRFAPEYAGFVFAKSRRQISPSGAGVLREALDRKIQAAGVFVNAPLEEVVDICQKGIIDLVQLHGDEDAEYMEKLKAQVPQKLVKAVRVRSREQIIQAAQLPCHMLLLDTYTPGQYGGCGKDFAVSLIPAIQKPFFLAGGLCVQNVREKIRDCRPYGVDVSSGVETEGYKDREKIEEFIEQVREEERHGKR